MVFVRVWEGLGNQLFQYAYARALALRTGQKVYLDISAYEGNGKHIRQYGLCHFRIRLATLNCGNIFPLANDDKYYMTGIRYPRYLPVKFIREDNCCFNSDFCSLGGLTYVKGWFQNENYFKEFEQNIRKEIYPKERIRIPKEMRNILDGKNTVSVHIRRGDFKKDHNVLPVSYYEKAKRCITDLVDKPYYLIFSDDISWVKQNMDFGSRSFFMGETHLFKDYEELMIMSRCRHNVIANSTFSWWGAWINAYEEKIVIAPKKWFLRSSRTDADIVPDNWIKL